MDGAEFPKAVKLGARELVKALADIDLGRIEKEPGVWLPPGPGCRR